MDREAKVRTIFVITASAIAAFVLCGVSLSRPITIYNVQVAAPQSVPAAAPSDAASEAGGAADGEQLVLVEKSVDLNQADQETLELLPRVGPALAGRIIEYREENNGFIDLEELMEVDGVGEKIFAAIEPYLTLE